MTGTDSNLTGFMQRSLQLMLLGLGIAVGTLATSPVNQAIAADQAENKDNCTEIADREARLKCFDNMVNTLLLMTTEDATAGDTSIETLKRRPLSPESEQSYTVRIVHYRRDPMLKWILTLENGEVWRQVDIRQVRLRGRTIEGQIIQTGEDSYYFIPANGERPIAISRMK